MMSSKLDQRNKTQRRVLIVITAIVAVAIFGSVAVFSYLQHKPRDEARAALWDIQGAPCPELTPEAFAALPIKVKSTVTFDALTIGRAYGHMECEDVPYAGWRSFKRYPACQLTGPAVLSVAVAGKTTYFNPGFGERTTIGLPDGKLKCVVGGNFGLFQSR